MVPVGFTVTLYEDDGFSGSQYVVQGSEESSGYMTCHTMHDWNDKLTSATIVKNAYPYAQGYWQLMGTGNTTYEFTWGFFNENTSSTTSQMQTTMSLEMDRGIEHRGKKMSSTYQQTTT